MCNPNFGSENYVIPLVDDDWITVVATYNDPCTASTYELKHVYITDCSGLEEKILIYPNPSNGMFYVTMADSPILTGSHITITDQFNAIKFHTQTDSDINNIQVTLPTGMYYLNWYGTDFNYSRLIYISY